jgi:hypothetical protein
MPTRLRRAPRNPNQPPRDRALREAEEQATVIPQTGGDADFNLTQEPTEANERNSSGPPRDGGSRTIGLLGLALQIRVSDLGAHRFDHRHRSFARADKGSRTAVTLFDCRGGYLWGHLRSGTSTQCVGNRLWCFARHLDMPSVAVSDSAKVAGYICGIVVVAHGTHP